MKRWILRRLNPSTTTRVLGAVVLAGLVVLGLSTLSLVRVVGEENEATIVNAALRQATEGSEKLDQHVAIARARLEAAALAASMGETLDTALPTGLLAMRCVRDGVSLLDAAVDARASRLIRGQSLHGEDVRLLDSEHLLVGVDAAGVRATGLLFLPHVLPMPEGWELNVQPGDSTAVPAVMAQRESTEDGQDIVVVRAPTESGPMLVLRAPVAAAQQAAWDLTRRAALWAMLAVVPLVLLAGFFARIVTRPIRRLAHAVRRVPLEVPSLPHDEIGELGQAIQDMSYRLHDDARMLHTTLRFQRRVARLREPEDVLKELEEALRDALGDARWWVLPMDHVDQGSVPEEMGLSAVAIRRILGSTPPPVAASPPSDEPRLPAVDTTQHLVRAVRIDDGEGTIVIPLRAPTSAYGIVVGHGATTDELANRAELLAQAALFGLRNLELLEAAVTNEKLAVLGRLSASVAHEMNNPLAYLLANLRALDGRLSGEHAEIAREARQGADRLANIVRDLSTMSRGTRRPTLERVDLVEIVEEAMRTASARRPEIPIGVEAEGAVPVHCSRGRIGQAVLNILINALDAAMDHDSPSVRVAVQMLGSQAVVDVRDNGLGIAPGARRRIFDPFFTTKGQEGTGLGLFLSRTFAQAHGGNIDLVYTGAEGSGFRLTLPLTSVQQMKPVTDRTPMPLRGRPRVLVVDDEPALVRGMERWLRDRADVTGSTDPIEALELACSGEYSVVLCDLHMPKMTGEQFVQEVTRRDPDLGKRVVIMTGSSYEGLDGTRVVEKPVRPSVIDELVPREGG